MNRRQFLYQTLSASAVLVGTGYASVDMIRRSSKVWGPTEAEQAKAAVEQALKGAPLVDEAVSHSATPFAAAPDREGLSYAQPARAMQSMGPRYETPNEATGLTVPASSEAVADVSPQPAISNTLAPDFATMTPAQPEGPVLDETAAAVEAPVYVAEVEDEAERVRQKVEHFEYDFSDDVLMTDTEYTTLVSALERLNRVQSYVGHGHFNVLSFDDMLRYARYQPRIGDFPTAELDYLEKLFYDDVSRLGFFGERVISDLTHSYAENDISKIPGSGHYLLRGDSEAFYDKVREKVGDTLLLTSGVRGVVKQYHLFMAKAVQAEGNLSRASRSLAPPGHSYHAIGDFDVGRVNGGLSNFTADFAQTDEFKRLQDLGFVKIRYTTDNEYGVRYEPWHIRVV
ncbi:MAG: D-alanyl-D-alanine carboxypeptidase family protein [Saccharospirillum sp.]|uniref:D-alanyl-D-alanine carboxypeptidase family protein n=1 Tax=Saccharospirillum sp. TaxID=2033801 RepID=UPI003297B6DA